MDIEYIGKICNTIVKFIIKNSQKNYDTLKGNEIDSRNTAMSVNIPEIVKKMDEVRNEGREILEFNQSFENDILEDLYTIYPQFSLIHNLGKYELKNINVRDSFIGYVDNPEIDKIYTIEPKLDNIGNINFMFITSYGKQISINFDIEEKASNSSKSVVLEHQYEAYNHIQDEEIKIKDEVYRAMYSKGSNNFNGLYGEIDGVKRNYKVAITTYDEESWNYKTFESGVKVYNELKIKDFIENILNTFENNL